MRRQFALGVVAVLFLSHLSIGPASDDSGFVVAFWLFPALPSRTDGSWICTRLVNLGSSPARLIFRKPSATVRPPTPAWSPIYPTERSGSGWSATCSGQGFSGVRKN